METINRNRVFLFVLAGALLVYLYAHRAEMFSPYVINDDVRQQIYWMQTWQDQELFQDHYLTDYSKQYVPWGIQAVYWVASHGINPVQFSKILSALLYLVTAGLLFRFATRYGDELTGVITVCLFCYFGLFLGSASGGLSRGFVFPFLILYLLFLSKQEMVKAGLVLMLQALFNPYLFVLCFVTHIVFLVHTLLIVHSTHPSIEKTAGSDDPDRSNLRTIYGRLLAQQLPVVLGVLIIAAKYIVFSDPAFGHLVSGTDMEGKIEYTIDGRYGIVPVPSVFIEIVRPFILSLPIGGVNIAAAVTGVLILFFVFISGWEKGIVYRNVRKTKVFGYLIISSILLYVLSRLFILELFLPRRYLEYSLTLIYCVSAGLVIRSALRKRSGKYILILSALLMMLGALRCQNVGIYDYSDYAALYKFFLTTQKDSNIAGHPEIMDNVMTFSERKAFITYELSHTWYDRYWLTIKQRTYDFFTAYYAEEADTIRQFCNRYNINYLVIRERDFARQNSGEKAVYFEPFGSYIQSLKEKSPRYVLLDENVFRPVFKYGGIRVVTVNQ